MSDHQGTGIHDKVLGTVKEMVGSVLHDDDLKEEGRLHRARVNAATEAEDAATFASQREAEAAVVAGQQELKAESERLRAEELRDAEIDRVERSRLAGHAEIDAEARQREILLAHQQSEQELALEKALATAVNQRQMAENRAVETEREADQARQVADALDRGVPDRPRNRT